MKKLVIIPGGFHPFHAGHYQTYKNAVAKFPGADVYVAATNDKSTRPFPFDLKKKLAVLAGVPAERFIQVKSPFRADEITQHYDPKNTILIFVRSEKDSNSQPLAGGTKKDGSPSYLQPFPARGRETMDKHAYMAYMPTVQFGGMSSATEIRAKWPDMDEAERSAMINTLYPATVNNEKLTQVVMKMYNAVLDTGMKEAKVIEADDAITVIPHRATEAFTEADLVANIATDLKAIAEMLKGADFNGAYNLLYGPSSIESKFAALADVDNYKQTHVQTSDEEDIQVMPSDVDLVGEPGSSDYIDEI